MKSIFTGLLTVTIILCSFPVKGEGDQSIYSQPFITKKMKEVYRWQVEHPVAINDVTEQWARSVFYSGIMYAYNTTGDKEYLNQTKKWADGWSWKRGKRIRHADDLACGQAYLDVYAVEKEKKMLVGIQGAVDSLIANPRTGREDWWWCDALFMEPPVLARLGNITGNSIYYDYLNEKYWDSSDYLYDSADSLYYRDKRFFTALTANGKKVFWGRGNAWVLGGLTQLLTLMPESNSYRPRFVEHYKQMVEKIASLQQSDGLWRASLLDPEEVPVKETSASTFFTYAMAWGINNGLLSQEIYLPKVQKAWEALLRCVDKEGKLGYVQAIGASPENVKMSDNQEYGSGAFLMAASEIMKLIQGGNKDRAYWVSSLTRIADPVLESLNNGALRERMPFEAHTEGRLECSYLEAVGRLVCGISPWLELGPDETPEGKLRAKYIDLTVKGLTNAVNPKSLDYLPFGPHHQALVDAAFLAQGLLRAPNQLWGNLSDDAKKNMVTELKRSRAIKPGQNNWLLFASMVEAALLEFTGECDMERLQYGVKRFRDDWYKGDAMYGDGSVFHMDYYNSYVIHPMLTDVLGIMKKQTIEGTNFLDIQLQRHTRYAEILERFISPEGTYPVVGRSIAYRFGAFHALSQAALMHILPEQVEPAQVRCALTAVMRKQLKSPANFDKNGWLRVGFTGEQIDISEHYINTGSVYLCTFGFLALGLPATDEFWSVSYTEWTTLKAWNGKKVNADHALSK